MIVTRHLDLKTEVSPASIGAVGAPINVRLVLSDGVTPTLTASSEGSIHLSLEGTAPSFPQIDLGPIVAALDANVEIKEGHDAGGNARPTFVDVVEITGDRSVTLRSARGIVTLLNRGGDQPRLNAGLTSSGTVTVDIADGILNDGGFSFVDESR
jgi:hypothetical protein